MADTQSIIGKGAIFKGKISNASTIEINGRVEADIKSEKVTVGKQASLEVLHEAARSRNQDQSWLNSKDLGKSLRLADSLNPAKGRELAVETVLGPYMQSVLISDINSVSQLVGDFNEGELLLIEDRKEEVFDHQKSKNTFLSEFISNKHTKPLLDHVYAVDTLDDALSKRPDLKSHESVITKCGIWLGVNWLRAVSYTHLTLPTNREV